MSRPPFALSLLLAIAVSPLAVGQPKPPARPDDRKVQPIPAPKSVHPPTVAVASAIVFLREGLARTPAGARGVREALLAALRESEANKELVLAKAVWRIEGGKELGMVRLKRVIERYPWTQAAAEADRLIRTPVKPSTGDP